MTKQQHNGKPHIEKKKTPFWKSFLKALYTVVTFPARCFHVISSSRTTLAQVLSSATKKSLLRGYSADPPPVPPPQISESTFQFAQLAHKVVEGLQKANEYVVPLALTVDAVRIGKSTYSERKFGKSTSKLTTEITGSWLGSYAGGFVGGIAGSGLGMLVFAIFGGPSVASAAGSIAGGFIGSVVGSMGGTKGGTKLFDYWTVGSTAEDRDKPKKIIEAVDGQTLQNGK